MLLQKRPLRARRIGRGRGQRRKRDETKIRPNFIVNANEEEFEAC